MTYAPFDIPILKSLLKERNVIKGTVRTQSFYIIPIQTENYKRANWQHKNATKIFDFIVIADRNEWSPLRKTNGRLFYCR